MDKRTSLYVDKLSQMINVKTVSKLNSFDKDSFDKFHNLLKELFPNVFDSFKYEEINGSILLTYLIDNDLDPILLMSHHDVVSENGIWEHEAFNATVDNNKLYGRGTLDTKGNLFAILQSLEEALIEGYKFNRSIYVFSGCNEEISGEGANEMSKLLLEKNVKFYLTMDEGGVIVEEPFDGIKGKYAMVALAEKDCVDLRFKAKSLGGHASTPSVNDPFNRLARFVNDVSNKKLFKPCIHPLTLETFRRISKGASGLLKFVFKNAKYFKHITSKVLAKSPTSAALVKTTICFTRSSGSNEINVIPTEAYIDANLRVSHHDNKEDVIKKLSKIANKYDIELTILDNGYHSDVCSYKTEQFKLLESLIKDNFNVDTIPYISTGASDSRYLNSLSNNVFRFAPLVVTNSQLDAMHAKDENIDIDTLVPAVDFYKDLLRRI